MIRCYNCRLVSFYFSLVPLVTPILLRFFLLFLPSQSHISFSFLYLPSFAWHRSGSRMEVQLVILCAAATDTTIIETPALFSRGVHLVVLLQARLSANLCNAACRLHTWNSWSPYCSTYDTTVGPSIQQWRHWGGYGVTNLLCYFSQNLSPRVNCFEEVRYERYLGDIVLRLGGSLVLDSPADQGDVIGFSSPFDRIYFFTDSGDWLPDVDFKTSMHARERGILVD